MLLGCCHCGPDIQSDFPSVSNASILLPEEICGACYNFPSRWTVTFNSNWFFWITGGEPSDPDYMVDCPMPSGDFDYTLKRVTGSSETLCAVWESDERATNLAGNPCDPEDTEFELCSPWYPTARVKLTATRLEDDSTLLTLTYTWVRCVGTNPDDAVAMGYIWRWRIFRTPTGNLKSCVRFFQLNYHEPFSTEFEGGSPPYGLSDVYTGWEQILLGPAAPPVPP